MESKLKALKVVELREILSKASVSAPAKANKQDLIARIISSDKAVQVYYSLNPSSKPAPSDDLLAPPEDVDWTADEATVPEVTIKATSQPSFDSVSPIVTAENAPLAVTPTAASRGAVPTRTKKTEKSGPAAAIMQPSTDNRPEAEDDELVKRKARAARFGIPVVEPQSPKTNTRARSAVKNKPSDTSQDPEKLAARARRFGTASTVAPAHNTAITGQKRAAAIPLDAEEEERRRKRAERFATT